MLSDNSANIVAHLEEMKKYFDSQETKSYSFRKEQLLLLRNNILKYENDLYEALFNDLKKSKEEVWITETGFVLTEISYALKHLKKWMHAAKTSTNILNFPSSSYVLKEPLGIVLIISPWNYPFQLLFTPMIGAIAAGNCAVLKPSEFAPATAAVMRHIINETFSNKYIAFIEGDGAEIVPAMMNHFTFNHVFYTGSTHTGKLIYKMAADKLVPVTLELGGKSPCIIEQDADIKIAARRIATTKFSNAGQMCVAPDYILIHENIKEKFIAALSEYITAFYSKNPADNDGYGKIINEKQFTRLVAYLTNGTIVHGGRHDISKLFIEPTVLTNVSPDAPVMQEEIFGPVLPVLSFHTHSEAIGIIEHHKNPLAFYLFTKDSRNEKKWLEKISFGGGCINNASLHLTNPALPFGGRGFSGIGHYHGKYSFDTFSHAKAIMKSPLWFDPSIKYPPFKGKLNLFKKIIK